MMTMSLIEDLGPVLKLQRYEKVTRELLEKEPLCDVRCLHSITWLIVENPFVRNEVRP